MGHANLFSTFRETKKVTFMNSIKWCLSRRMALRNHNLPSGRLKKRLSRSRRSDVSRCRWAKRMHLKHPGNWKKWLSYSRLSDVLSRPMTLRTHNLLSKHKKKRLGWSRWSDGSRCRNAMRNHFFETSGFKKSIWTMTRKSCFKYANGPEKSSAFCTS
jgi:hypothetical protein